MNHWYVVKTKPKKEVLLEHIKLWEGRIAQAQEGEMAHELTAGAS